nr:integrase, catalytic region, zinc finger, CCHC-type, peptidase aspartic, catalytic [Tanacetum cinerariifolium]
MILESVKHGLLISPTIEENNVTRTKKYEELSATEKIQANCDLKATNIILQGLSSDVYSLINHHRVAKDLWDELIYIKETEMAKTVVKTDDCWKVTLKDSVQSQRRKGMILGLGIKFFWLKHKDVVVLNEEESEFLVDPRVAEAKAVLMANLSNYRLDVLSEDTNNRETHIYYLKYTIEQAAIVREIVEQAYSLKPLDASSYSSSNFVKLIQEFLGYVRDTCPDIHKPRLCRSTKSSRLKSTDNTKNDIILHISSSTKKKNKLEDNSRIVMSSLNKTNCVVEHSGYANAQHSKLNTNFKLMITATNKVPLKEPIPLEVIAQEFVVTKVYTRRPKETKIYTLSMGDMMTSSPIYLLFKATKTKSWLWHRRLSHLNFAVINHLARNGLIQGPPKLKFEKDHLCSINAYRVYNRHTQKIIETIHVDFNDLTTIASKQLGLGPGLQSMTLVTSSLGLVPNPIPQQPCIPPPRYDWDRLFQPMFDEYFNPPTIVVSSVQDLVVPRTIDLANSPVFTSIDQDAPSTSIPSSQEQEHYQIISQGFEESLKTPHFHDDLLHESLHEESTSQGSSSNVRPIHTPFESLGRWTKDHPIANVRIVLKCAKIPKTGQYLHKIRSHKEKPDQE